MSRDPINDVNSRYDVALCAGRCGEHIHYSSNS